jgi:hypothetical protein
VAEEAAEAALSVADETWEARESLMLLVSRILWREEADLRGGGNDRAGGVEDRADGRCGVRGLGSKRRGDAGSQRRGSAGGTSGDRGSGTRVDGGEASGGGDDAAVRVGGGSDKGLGGDGGALSGRGRGRGRGRGGSAGQGGGQDGQSRSRDGGGKVLAKTSSVGDGLGRLLLTAGLTAAVTNTVGPVALAAEAGSVTRGAAVLGVGDHVHVADAQSLEGGLASRHGMVGVNGGEYGTYSTIAQVLGRGDANGDSEDGKGLHSELDEGMLRNEVLS